MASIYIRHELLRAEFLRLDTMTELMIPYEDKKIIAKAGFYYDGLNELFFCFSCNYSASIKCKPHKMVREHFNTFKDCWFCLGCDISVPTKPNCHFKNSPSCSNISFMNRDVDNYIWQNYSIYNPLIIIHKIQPICERKYLHSIASRYFIPNGKSTVETFSVDNFFLQMRSESNRLSTFNVTNYEFPIPNFSKYLAKCGFFYCLTGTNIQCCMCRIIVGDLDENMDIETLHQACSKSCPWVRGDQHNNVGLVEACAEANENLLCKICYSEIINIVHICGHVSICSKCLKQLRQKTCIICRAKLEGERKLYFT
jgi:hypothetical protein